MREVPSQLIISNLLVFPHEDPSQCCYEFSSVGVCSAGVAICCPRVSTCSSQSTGLSIALLSEGPFSASGPSQNYNGWRIDNSLSFFFFSEASLFVPLPAFWIHDTSRPTRSPSHDKLHDLLFIAPFCLKVLKLCNRTALAPILHTGRCWTEGNIFVSSITTRRFLDLTLKCTLMRPKLA